MVRGADKRVVLVTCGSIKEARRIARGVVGKRLAACVNLGTAKVESVYWWKGKVETAKEFLLVMKTTVARVALAWVRMKPGVTSTIIGARRLSQLDDNVQSLDVTLSAEELARLDALTKPVFGFPQSMQPMFPAIHNGGTTVNGVHEPLMMMQPGEKPC